MYNELTDANYVSALPMGKLRSDSHTVDLVPGMPVAHSLVVISDPSPQPIIVPVSSEIWFLTDIGLTIVSLLIYYILHKASPANHITIVSMLI
jgi:hypothetical protein